VGQCHNSDLSLQTPTTGQTKQILNMPVSRTPGKRQDCWLELTAWEQMEDGRTSLCMRRRLNKEAAIAMLRKKNYYLEGRQPGRSRR